MAPTLVWLDSFHHRRDSTAVTYTAQNPIYDTTGRVGGETTVAGRRAGSLALQLVEDGSTATNVTKSVTAGNRVLVESFYIRVTAKPSGDSTLWFGTATVGGLVAMRSATGFIYSRISAGGTEQTGNVDCSDGAWHRIDVKFVTSANGYTLDVQVDGAALTQATVTSTAADITQGGLGATAAANTLTCQYTDWVRSVTSGDYPIGAHRCLPLIPNADGTHSWTSTNMGDSTGGRLSSVTDLNTMVADWATVVANTTDYIAYINTTATSTEYAEITLPDVASGLTVWGARAVAAIFSGSTAINSATTRVVNGAGTTQVDVFTGDQSDTAPRVQAAMVPSITSDTLLNALKFRVGFPTDSNPNPRWSALMIDYAAPGDGGTQTAQAVDVAATLALGSVKNTGKPVPATTTHTVAQLRSTTHSIAAATALTLGRVSQVGKPIAASVTNTIVLTRSKVAPAVIAAATALTTAIGAIKVSLKSIAATTTVTAALVRRTGKLVTVTTTVGAVLARMVPKAISGTITLAVALTRRTAHVVAAPATLTAALVRRMAETIAATTILTAVLAAVRVIRRSVAATTSITAAISRSISHRVAMAVSTVFDVVLARGVGKVLDAGLVVAVELQRGVAKVIGVLLDMGALLKAKSSRLAHGRSLNGPTDADTGGDAHGATTTGADPWGADTGEGR